MQTGMECREKKTSVLLSGSALMRGGGCVEVFGSIFTYFCIVQHVHERRLINIFFRKLFFHSFFLSGAKYESHLQATAAKLNTEKLFFLFIVRHGIVNAAKCE